MKGLPFPNAKAKPHNRKESPPNEKQNLNMLGCLCINTKTQVSKVLDQNVRDILAPHRAGLKETKSSLKKS